MCREDIMSKEEIVLNLLRRGKYLSIEPLDDVSLSCRQEGGDPSRVDHTIAER